jgi:hypothetical protein
LKFSVLAIVHLSSLMSSLLLGTSGTHITFLQSARNLAVLPLLGLMEAGVALLAHGCLDPPAAVLMVSPLRMRTQRLQLAV